MLLHICIRKYFSIFSILPIATFRRLLFIFKKLSSKWIILPMLYLVMLVISRHYQSDTSHMQVEGLVSKSILKREKLKHKTVHGNYAKSVKASRMKLCTDLPSILIGNMSINPNITPTFSEVSKVAGPKLSKGGCHFPAACRPLQKVAIIIPYKDRDRHLRTLLYYVHPMLMRQRSYYCVYVAEQYDTGQFNKAMIMNAAFVEAMKLNSYDCIIFHDVDMIPESDENIYGCGSSPRHLSPAINKFGYKPHYGTDFGGVTAISPSQYKKVNGHSNEFWGWGGEDNDIEFRIRFKGMEIEPSPLRVGRYQMIDHYHPWKFKPGKFPFFLNKTREARIKTDGLSDLSYRLMETVKFSTYTKFMIDIRRVEVKKISMFVDGKKAMNFDLPPAEGRCRYEPYIGKYLDFNIDLRNFKEAQPYRPTPAPNVNIPQEIKAKIPPDTRRFSSVKSYKIAKKLCELIQPQCNGIQQGPKDKFTLKEGMISRNLFLTFTRGRPGSSWGRTAEKMQYVFPNTSAFVRYCPGDASAVQKYDTIIPVDLSQHSSKAQHRYSFEIHLSILLQPTKYIYYSDTKMLGGQVDVGESFYTFKWPGGGPAPNFRMANTPKNFVFKTDNFSFPTIPGCYGMESRIVSRQLHPYFQWNWWFEVSSGDRIRDARIQDLYRKKLLKSRNVKHRKERDARKKVKQIAREYAFEKKMAELQKLPFQTKPELESLTDMPGNLAEKINTDNDLPQTEILDDIIDEVEQTAKKQDNRISKKHKKGFHLPVSPKRVHKAIKTHKE